MHKIKTQQFYTDLDLYQQCYVLQKIEEFKNFSWHLSDSQVLFKAYLVFKTFQESPQNSSTFQACANPDLGWSTVCDSGISYTYLLAFYNFTLLMRRTACIFYKTHLGTFCDIFNQLEKYCINIWELCTSHLYIPPPSTGDTGDIAGLNCRNLTYDVSPENANPSVQLFWCAVGF